MSQCFLLVITDRHKFGTLMMLGESFEVILCYSAAANQSKSDWAIKNWDLHTHETETTASRLLLW